MCFPLESANRFTSTGQRPGKCEVDDFPGKVRTSGDVFKPLTAFYFTTFGDYCLLFF